MVNRFSFCIWSVLAIALFGAAACTDVQPTVDRTQPGKIEKAVFTNSEWYSASTVIDSPYSNSAFIGSGTSAAKITWDIQEHHLIARATRSFLDNEESDATVGEGAGQPSVVAMYVIESHFDIRRAYNPVTGEEQNVIDENTSDRPWYERDYMRVDWSQNLAGDLGVALTGGMGEVSLAPIAYYINNPNEPFAPKFETDEDGVVTYIDIVNKYLMDPAATMYIDESGNPIPDCFLIIGSHLDCNPAEVAIRNSFVRVEDRDYQPHEYTVDRMTRAGYFLTTRDTYDRDYGPVATERLRLVNRHNIWQKSYQRTSNGKRKECNADADCNGGGAVCDSLGVRTLPPTKRPDAAGFCTLPYRERKVRPIAYHLSTNFPEDLIPAAEHIADGWNEAFVETVGSLRELECKEFGGDNCAAERDRADGKNVFVLCHNPVTTEDNAACGEPGTSAKIGDLRYSTLAFLNDPHRSSPLGYGPSQIDSDTGEIFAGTAYTYGAPMDIYTAQGRDMVALINGDLDEAQVTDNDAFGDWMDGFRNEQTARMASSVRESDQHVVKLDGADAKRIASAMSDSWLLDRLGTAQSVPRFGEWGARLRAAKEATADVLAETRLDRGRALLDRVKGTELERMMMTPEHLLAANIDPGTPITDEILEAASPLRGQSTQRMRAISDIHHKIGHHQNTCALRAEFMDEGLIGLAREIAREAQGDGTITWYGKEYQIATDGVVDYDLVKRMLRIPIFHALTQHEVGHTLGLRHNFGGSYDSLNYFPEYWALRSADGTMRGRAWDPKTQEEIDGRIEEFAYTSVMDYGANFIVSDAHGPGKYDRAAIKLGYGDVVEVFQNSTGINAAAAAVAAVLGADGIGPLDIRPSSAVGGGLSFIPYTEMPELVGGLEGLEAREDIMYRNAKEDPMVVTAFGEPTAGVFGATLKSLDDQGRLVVPYFYCGDEFADNDPNCQRYDAGADKYETAMSVLDQYWNNYIFGSFMRQKLGFNPDSRGDSVYSRYFTKFQTWNLYYSFYKGIASQIGGGPGFLDAENGFGPFTLAVGGSYGMLTRVLAAPEPGTYGASAMLDGSMAYQRGNGASQITINGFDGRILSAGYDFGPDFSWIFFTRAGFSQDKHLALETLLDSGRSSVFGTDLRSSDLRQLQVSFYTTFETSMNEIMRGVISEDWSRYSPRYMSASEGIVYPDASQQAGFTPMDGVQIDPNTEFTLQVSAMVYSMALTPRTFSQTYIDRARIFVRGGSESATLDASRPTVSFVDERSGLEYIAPSYLDADGRETGVSAQALQHAQMLADANRAQELALYIDNLNALRMLTHLYGNGGDTASLGGE